jgi:anti-sigma factor RsiW
MMTTRFTCDDKATLVAYMYGEVDAVVRDRIEAHLAGCDACAAEVTALGDVRAELGLWLPPDAELGFAIVKKSEQPAANVLRPSQWWRTVPAWAQAAAAVLVVGAGLGLANVQIRSGHDGISVSTGWMQPVAAPALGQPADSAAVEQRVERALVSLEQQLRNEIRTSREQQQPNTTRAAAPAADDATIRRVQQLIAASEERQARQLAIRMTQFASDMNMQRRADLQLIRQGFGQQEELMLRQRQMLNNVLRVSASGQQ